MFDEVLDVVIVAVVALLGLAAGFALGKMRGQASARMAKASEVDALRGSCEAMKDDNARLAALRVALDRDLRQRHESAEVLLIIILRQRRIVRLLVVARINGQNRIVAVHRLVQPAFEVAEHAHIRNLRQRGQRLAEGNVHVNFIVGDNERALVRHVIHRVSARRVLARNGVSRRRQVLLQRVPRVLLHPNHAVLHAAAHKIADRAPKPRVIADADDFRIHLLALGLAVRRDAGIARRNKAAARRKRAA